MRGAPEDPRSNDNEPVYPERVASIPDVAFVEIDFAAVQFFFRALSLLVWIRSGVSSGISLANPGAICEVLITPFSKMVCVQTI